MVDSIAIGKAQKQFQKRYKKRTTHYALTSFFTNLLIFVVTGIVILGFILVPYQVYGDGMSPAITKDSIVIACPLSYEFRTPQRGDVIVSNNHLYRVIGLPGDKIQFNGGEIFINKKLVHEDYLDKGTLTFPVIGKTDDVYVPDDSYYVLCDNRLCYDDSRSGMMITKDSIKYKVLFIL